MAGHYIQPCTVLCFQEGKIMRRIIHLQYHELPLTAGVSPHRLSSKLIASLLVVFITGRPWNPTLAVDVAVLGSWSLKRSCIFPIFRCICLLCIHVCIIARSIGRIPLHWTVGGRQGGSWSVREKVQWHIKYKVKWEWFITSLPCHQRAL